MNDPQGLKTFVKSVLKLETIFLQGDETPDFSGEFFPSEIETSSCKLPQIILEKNCREDLAQPARVYKVGQIF